MIIFGEFVEALYGDLDHERFEICLSKDSVGTTADHDNRDVVFGCKQQGLRELFFVSDAHEILRSGLHAEG